MNYFKKLWNMRGAIKVYGDVQRYYLALAQFLLLAYLVVKETDYTILEIILIAIGFFLLLTLITIFHVRYIMPEEYDYLNRRDRVKMETLERVKK